MRLRGRPPHPDVLTPREWAVFHLLRDRRTNEEIAQHLGITLDGAKYHVSSILSKLGVSSRIEASQWQPVPVTAPRPWGWLFLLGKIAGVGAAATAIVGVGALGYGVLQSRDPHSATEASVSRDLRDAPQIVDNAAGQTTSNRYNAPQDAPRSADAPAAGPAQSSQLLSFGSPASGSDGPTEERDVNPRLPAGVGPSTSPTPTARSTSPACANCSVTPTPTQRGPSPTAKPSPQESDAQYEPAPTPTPTATPAPTSAPTSPPTAAQSPEPSETEDASTESPAPSVTAEPQETAEPTGAYQ